MDATADIIFIIKFHQSNLHIKKFVFHCRKWGRNILREEKRWSGGGAPRKIWHIFRWENNLATHEISPENPVTFQKRAVAGGGKMSLDDG